MNVPYMTSSALISQIKRVSMMPTSNSTFQDSDFLAMANQEIRIGLTPTIMSYHQEYLTVDSDPVTIVANQSSYPIPYRALGGQIRDVFYRDENGNLRSLTRIDPDHRPYYQQSNFSNSFIYFYIQGNSIVLAPNVQGDPTGSLVFTYFMRPNSLVDESRVATILSQSVGASTTVYTVDQIPTGVAAFLQGGNTITGFTTSATYDFCQTRPGHKIMGIDKSPTAVDSVNLTMTFNNTDIPTDLIVGDYISFSQESVIPNVPTDLHDVLCQRVVTRCLEALGDQQGLAAAKGKLQEMEQKTGDLIANRASGNPQKITNLNGLLRTTKSRRKGWL